MLSKVLIYLLLILPMVAVSAFAQGNIFGTVTNSDATTPGENDFTFFGFLDDTDEEIRIESATGAGYDAGNWFDDFQNYLTEAPGNPYDYYFYNLSNNEGFVLSELIPNDSYKEENITLAPVSWPDKPADLAGEATSVSSIELTWTSVAGLTYHIYRRMASSNGSFFRIDDPTGSLSSPGVSGGVYIDNTVDGSSTYHYLIIARDGEGNFSPHSDFITVTSQEPETPVITCPGDITIDCAASTDPENTGYATATDNIDPEPVITYIDEEEEGNCPQERVIYRTWTATDSDENSSDCVQTIRIEDNSEPELTCPDNIQVAFGESTDPENTGQASAVDNCDENPSIAFADEQVDNIITRTWTAIDACGNEAQCIQEIEIIYYSGPNWFVAVEGSDTNDGSPEYPFATIQHAIDIASAEDTVLINEGIYTGEGNRDISTGGKYIYISSIEGPEETVIDCEGTAGSPHRAFIFNGGEGSGTVIASLTIRNGYSKEEGGGIICVESQPSIDSCIFDYNRATRGGGAIWCSDASPEIIDCIFTGNQTTSGGGGIWCKNASPEIRGCSFTGNNATRYGGALYITGTSAAPTIQNCTFTENHANEVGGAVLCISSSPTIDLNNFYNNTAGEYGGAVCLQESSPEITACTLSVNSSQKMGGGIYCDNSSPSIDGCTFVGNETVNFGGGVMCNYSSAPAISNTLFLRNKANTGGAVFCSISSPHISGCTFYDNSAAGSGGGIALSLNSEPEIETSIIAFGSQGEAIYCSDASSNPVISCTDIFGNTGGDWVGCIEEMNDLEGNFSLDPYFCDEMNDDFHLAGISPCMPDNNECGEQIGALGFGCDEPTDINDDTGEGGLPEGFVLHQNHPNPFNPSTTISFALPVRSDINLSVFNILGRKVATIADDTYEAGYHSLIWDGRDSEGREVSSGVYFYRLDTDKFSECRKMLLIK